MSNSQRKELFGDRGPLGTFSSKVAIAKAMGATDQQTTQYLNAIRLIRNEFAHDMKPLDFTAEPVLNHCANLPDPDFFAGTAKLVPPEDKNQRMRARFIEKAHDLLILLLDGLQIEESPETSP